MFGFVAELIDPGKLPTYGGVPGELLRLRDDRRRHHHGQRAAAPARRDGDPPGADDRDARGAAGHADARRPRCRPARSRSTSCSSRSAWALLLAVVAHARPRLRRRAGSCRASCCSPAFVPFVWGLGLVTAAAIVTFRRGERPARRDHERPRARLGRVLPARAAARWLQTVAEANPVAIVIEGTREALIGGAGWSAIGPDVARARRASRPPRCSRASPPSAPRWRASTAAAPWGSTEVWERIDSLLAAGTSSLDVLRLHRVELLEARRGAGRRPAAGAIWSPTQTRVAVDEMAAPPLLAPRARGVRRPARARQGPRGRARLRRRGLRQLRRPRPADRRRRGGAGGAARRRLPGGLRPRALRGHPPPAPALVAGPAARRRAAHARELAGRDPRRRRPRAARGRRARAGSASTASTTLPPAHHALLLAAHAWAHQPLGPPRQPDRRRRHAAAQRPRRGRRARAPLGLPAHVAHHPRRHPRRARGRGPLGRRRRCGRGTSRRARAHGARVARQGPAGAGLGPAAARAAAAVRAEVLADGRPRGSRVVAGEAEPRADRGRQRGRWRARSTTWCWSEQRRRRDDRAATAGRRTCTGARSTAR